MSRSHTIKVRALAATTGLAVVEASAEVFLFSGHRWNGTRIVILS